jgi:hypothetical protein
MLVCTSLFDVVTTDSVGGSSLDLSKCTLPEMPGEIINFIKSAAQKNTIMNQVKQRTNSSLRMRACIDSQLFEHELTLLHQMFAGVALTLISLMAFAFYQHSTLMAEYLSEPQLMMRGRGRDGGTIMIDDFREAYWWVRDNTPKDSRIMCV